MKRPTFAIRQGVKLELPDGDFDGLIFDCDGTLVDSMPLHHRAWRAALWEAGARFDFSWQLFTSRAGMGLPETVAELNRQFGTALDPSVVVAVQRAHFEQLLPEVKAIDSVVSIARANHGVRPMAVASGGEKSIVLRSLDVLGIRHLFDLVICREDVVRGKPDPEMFLTCAAHMGVNPERCVVFEDGEMGIQASIAARMPYVRVPVIEPLDSEP